MAKEMIKIYAAFRSGCLGKNILDAYFPFFANIICEENWDFVDEGLVAKKFEEKYHIPVTLNFVRQVLGMGMQNNSIIDDFGRYKVQKVSMEIFKFDSSSFDSLWNTMIQEFKKYCLENNLDISNCNIDSCILNSIDAYDESIVLNDELSAPENADSFDYAWYSFDPTPQNCTN